MDQAPGGPVQVQLRGVWHSADELPVHLVNQIAVQELQGSVFLTFGLGAPTIIDGTDSERVQEAIKAGLRIEPVVRLAMPLENFRTLLGNLQGLMDQIEKAKEPNEVSE